jgi:uncharacterized repeat protein (TIGR01451 family)
MSYGDYTGVYADSLSDTSVWPVPPQSSAWRLARYFRLAFPGGYNFDTPAVLWLDSDDIKTLSYQGPTGSAARAGIAAVRIGYVRKSLLNGLDLDYLIRFQNTGTYPAARVVITDTLSSDLDASSFHFIASSHPCTWSMERAVLYFIFDPIYLPDSALNEPGSHGFVRFSIKPIPSLADGAQVSNTANIYFDFNEPVITEPSIFQVDMGASVSEHGAPGAHIWPNPATDVLVIDLPSAMGTKGRCVVYDAMGRQMLQVPATGQRTIVSLAPLAPGAYRIHLIGGGHSSSHGFVKE